jgi:uncharacterized protein YjbJ (UPF0337 family)
MNDETEGTLDRAKGKVKEAVGDATDDRDLEREGKMDQVKGGAKKAMGDLKDAGEDAKRAVKDATS